MGVVREEPANPSAKVNDNKGVRGQGGKAAMKVSQATINSMKTAGMAKSIEKANSGTASAEFVEGAKRMYGNRVSGSPPAAAHPHVQDKRAQSGPTARPDGKDTGSHPILDHLNNIPKQV